MMNKKLACAMVGLVIGLSSFTAAAMSCAEERTMCLNSGGDRFECKLAYLECLD